MGFSSRASILLGLLVVAWGPLARAQVPNSTFDPSLRSEFREPVTLASKDGVLEVTLTAHQGEVRLDTVAVPVKNFLVFAYELVCDPSGRKCTGRLGPGWLTSVIHGH